MSGKSMNKSEIAEKAADQLDALHEWEEHTGKAATCSEGNAFLDGYRTGRERAIAESQAPMGNMGNSDHVREVTEMVAESQAPCAKCGGSGKLSTDGWGGVVFQKCYLCKGTGKVEPELAGDTRELKAAIEFKLPIVAKKLKEQYLKIDRIGQLDEADFRAAFLAEIEGL